MPNILKILRSTTAGARPVGKTEGELYVNFADKMFGVVDASGTPVDLLDTTGYLPLAAGPASPLTGELYLAGDPLTILGATPKQYVDTADGALQDQIALLAAAMLFVGSIDVVTDAGIYTAFSGFTNGPLPPAAPTNKGFYVIVSVAGVAAPGNIPPGTYNLGDWIISDGAIWISMPIGQSNVIAPNVAMSPAVNTWDDVQEAIEGLANGYLPLIGGTMTGPIAFNGAIIGANRSLFGQINGSNRWEMTLGDGSSSDFKINRYDDTGAFLSAPFQIVRGDGAFKLQTEKLSIRPNNTVYYPSIYFYTALSASGDSPDGGAVIGLYPDEFKATACGIIRGRFGTNPGWEIVMPNADLRTGINNEGANFEIRSIDDNNFLMPRAVFIERATGRTSFTSVAVNGSGATPYIGPIPPENSELILNKAPTGANDVVGALNGSTRWTVTLGNDAPEGVSNTPNEGSEFSINAWDDTGRHIGPVISASRTGKVTIPGFDSTALPFLPLAGGEMTGPIDFVADAGSSLIRLQTGPTANVFSIGHVGIAGNFTPRASFGEWTNVFHQDAQILGPSPDFGLHPTSPNVDRTIYGCAIDTRPRWKIFVGDAAPETGSNAGSNFSIRAYDDAGIIISTPIGIERATGVVTIPNIATTLDMGRF